MPLFNVRPEKENALQQRMTALGIREADLVERFIKGSGAGGQKINKTSSCVYLLHRPTGIEIKCQRERSQAMNRFLARRELCDRIEERARGAASVRQQAIEKIRRQKRRRSRRQKQRMLADKRHRSQKKQRRRAAADTADS
jgi:protein subunit release factor B